MELPKKGEALQENLDLENFMLSMSQALIEQYRSETTNSSRQFREGDDAIYLEIDADNRHYRVTTQEITTNHKMFAKESAKDTDRSAHCQMLQSGCSPMFTIMAEDQAYSFSVPEDMDHRSFAGRFLMESWPKHRDKTKPSIYSVVNSHWLPHNEIPVILVPLFRSLQ